MHPLSNSSNCFASQPLPSVIPLDCPFQTVSEINIEETDYYSTCTFKELIEENHHNKLGYIIAIARDRLGKISIQDGCSFAHQVYFQKNNSSALTRSNFEEAFFYQLPYQEIKNLRRSTSEDLTDSNFETTDELSHSNIEKSNNTNSVSISKKFKFICQLKDLASEWVFRFIEAHCLYPLPAPTQTIGEQRRNNDQYHLGLLYEFGPFEPLFGIVKPMPSTAEVLDRVALDFFSEDKEQAFYWYQMAVENGHIESHARLSRCYEKGIGCEKSEEKAFYYLQSGYNKNPQSYTVLQITLLAYYHLEGKGTERNEQMAQELLKIAQELLKNGTRTLE